MNNNNNNKKTIKLSLLRELFYMKTAKQPVASSIKQDLSEVKGEKCSTKTSQSLASKYLPKIWNLVLGI